jgi:hypothetical protein
MFDTIAKTSDIRNAGALSLLSQQERCRPKVKQQRENVGESQRIGPAAILGSSFSACRAAGVDDAAGRPALPNCVKRLLYRHLLVQRGEVLPHCRHYRLLPLLILVRHVWSKKILASYDNVQIGRRNG